MVFYNDNLLGHNVGGKILTTPTTNFYNFWRDTPKKEHMGCRAHVYPTPTTHPETTPNIKLWQFLFDLDETWWGSKVSNIMLAYGMAGDTFCPPQPLTPPTLKPPQ